MTSIPRKSPKPASRLAAQRKIGSLRSKFVVEGGHLERHLELLDQQAEKHFVFDFLDDIEASIDELISIGSLKKLRSASKGIDDTSMPTPTAAAEQPPLPVKKQAYDFEMPPDLITTAPKSSIGCTDTVNTNDDTVSSLS